MLQAQTTPLLLVSVLAAFGLIGCGGELSSAELDPAPTGEEEGVAASGVVANCSLGGSTYRCERDVPYGNHPLQRYDIWLPNGGATPRPLVVYIHGGGYYQGDKSSAYGRMFDPQVILDAGYAFATINYRLSGEFPYEKGVTGLYPPQMQDAGRAIQALRSSARRLGIDPTRVALTGGSAGGGISLWLAFHDDLALPESANPIERQSTRVSCAAVGQTQTTLDIGEIEALLADTFVLDVGVPGLYGFTPEAYNQDPAAYQARFAASFQEASPISHLSADDTAKIFMTYELPLGSGNIHSAEFGPYLAAGRPFALAQRYGRNNLAALGVPYTLRIAQPAAQGRQAINDFLLNHCFQ